LAVRLGRGRTGGSTGLDWLIQRAESEKREVIIADGDKRNATLSALYNGKSVQPETDEIPDVKDWISQVLDCMVASRRSVVLDLGGGDRVLPEYVRDLDLVGFCNHAGAFPLALYFIGPDADDLEHAWKIFTAEVFRPERTVIVLNEYLVKAGQTPATAFAKTVKNGQLMEMAQEGARMIYMPRLPCMGRVRELGLPLNAAAEGSKELGPTAAFMVRRWLHRLEDECERAGIDDWLP